MLFLDFQFRIEISLCWFFGFILLLVSLMVRVRLGCNICGRMRFLSGVGLGAVSLVRRGTAAIAPPLGTARHYRVKAVPPPKGKITSVITSKNLLMDFDGRWARRSAENKLERESFAESIQALKNERKKLEAQLERKRAQIAENSSGV